MEHLRHDKLILSDTNTPRRCTPNCGNHPFWVMGMACDADGPAKCTCHLSTSGCIHTTTLYREDLSCILTVDDIIIWSNTVEDHVRDLCIILSTLRGALLFINPKKCHFFRLEVDFLGHHISARGIEASNDKVEKILKWPRPKCAKDVRGLSGLVRYVAPYLPNLAEYTRVLTPLTTKDAQKHFPEWTERHETAFEAIKGLVISRECLTTIDYDNSGENKIFVTCDASDWRTGEVLSFGPTWE
jgi:hypothetical protein